MHTLLPRHDARRADARGRTAETNAHLYFSLRRVPFFQYPPLLTLRTFALPRAKGLLTVTALSVSPPIVLHAGIYRTTYVLGKTNLTIDAFITEKQGRKRTSFPVRHHSVRIRVALDLSFTFPRLTFNFSSTFHFSSTFRFPSTRFALFPLPRRTFPRL